MNTPPIETLILRELRQHGPQSRAQLARQLGVTRSTVGTQVAKLLERGVLCPGDDHDHAQSGAGRPGSAIDFNPHYRSFIGIDLGVRHLRGISTDLRGKTLAQTTEVFAVKDQTPDEMSKRIAKIITELQQSAPALDGVTISVPGLVNNEGMIVRLPFLNWQDVDLLSMIQSVLSNVCPIKIENDANLFANAELLSSAEPVKSAIYFWMDAGIGAGVVVNGTLLVGQNGQAGEIGHTFVRSAKGSASSRLDNSLGMTTLVQQTRDAGLNISTIGEFLTCIHEDNPATQKIMGTWTTVLSETLSSLISIFDPKAMIFSGPLTELLVSTLPDIERKTKMLLMHGTVMPSLMLANYDDLSLAGACVKARQVSFLETMNRSDHDQSHLNQMIS